MGAHRADAGRQARGGGARAQGDTERAAHGYERDEKEAEQAAGRGRSAAALEQRRRHARRPRGDTGPTQAAPVARRWAGTGLAREPPRTDRGGPAGNRAARQSAPSRADRAGRQARRRDQESHRGVRLDAATEGAPPGRRRTTGPGPPAPEGERAELSRARPTPGPGRRNEAARRGAHSQKNGRGDGEAVNQTSRTSQQRHASARRGDAGQTGREPRAGRQAGSGRGQGPPGADRRGPAGDTTARASGPARRGGRPGPGRRDDPRSHRDAQRGGATRAARQGPRPTGRPGPAGRDAKQAGRSRRPARPGGEFETKPLEAARTLEALERGDTDLGQETT